MQPRRDAASDKEPIHLVIGGLGLIGTALCAELEARKQDYRATTRRRDAVGGPLLYLDLAAVAAPDLPRPEAALPRAEVLYLVAAMTKFQECEGNPLSWQVNVDAPIRLAQRYRFSCVVFISSDSVEWCGNAYAREKAQVEAFIQSIGGVIVRPARVAPERVGELAKVIVDAGTTRKPGVIRWK